MLKIVCVIPAWNEEKSIVYVLRDVLRYVDTVVVVDDASIDNTLIALKLAKFSDNVKVLKHVVNRGQGASLQTGNEYALEIGADIIIHFDADNQFLASEITDVVKPLIDNEADVVFGSRFLSKKSNIPFFKEKVILPIGRIVNRIVMGENNLTDPQSGFRAMNANVARGITIEQDRMAHCSEIISKVIRSKYRLKEVPITVFYNEFGQKFSGGVNIIKELIFNKIIS
ncbi:glycosyltransferase family 2 protein [Patescibacteria group bacterium]|nr:glycosyltransferase family 2 protein [Patescibacteria group bacterium]